jgi:hypothetical protein
VLGPKRPRHERMESKVAKTPEEMEARAIEAFKDLGGRKSRWGDVIFLF